MPSITEVALSGPWRGAVARAAVVFVAAAAAAIPESWRR